jgi:hypothetical protein
MFSDPGRIRIYEPMVKSLLLSLSAAVAAAEVAVAVAAATAPSFVK